MTRGFPSEQELNQMHWFAKFFWQKHNTPSVMASLQSIPYRAYFIHLCVRLFTCLVKWAEINIKYNNRLVQPDLNSKSMSTDLNEVIQQQVICSKIFCFQIIILASYRQGLALVLPLFKYHLALRLIISLGDANEWCHYCHHFFELSCYV